MYLSIGSSSHERYTKPSHYYIQNDTLTPLLAPLLIIHPRGMSCSRFRYHNRGLYSGNEAKFRLKNSTTPHGRMKTLTGRRVF